MFKSILYLFTVLALLLPISSLADDGPAKPKDDAVIFMAKNYAQEHSPDILEMDDVKITILQRTENHVLVTIVGINIHTTKRYDENGHFVGKVTETSGASVDIYIDENTLKVIKVLHGQ